MEGDDILSVVGRRADSLPFPPGVPGGGPADGRPRRQSRAPDIPFPMDVVLYTRRGCHLCEVVEDILFHHAPRARIVEIGGDSALEDVYGLRVPVVTVDGRAVAEGRIDEASLIVALAAAFTARG